MPPTSSANVTQTALFAEVLDWQSAHLLPIIKPAYQTPFGGAYVGDARQLLAQVPDQSINLVVTSPPYALHYQKEYGNVAKEDYVEWFLEFARHIYRILPDNGSFILNIGGSYNKGLPTRSLYHFKLLISLIEDVGFHLAQELFWYNPAKMPMPAEWVTVRRIRVKDAVEYVWWLSKTPWPKASNRNVLRPYGEDMLRLNRKGLTKATRPSGHQIKPSFSQVEAGGAIPPNLIEPTQEEQLTPDELLRFGNNAANDNYATGCKQHGLKQHPARFPAALPEFFIKLLTDERDTVLDPFAGSNTTGAVCERLKRNWLAFDTSAEYIAGSQHRFTNLKN